ncbi:hypothetical protein GH714_008670 [Hevea brasiliensis]|uniref:Uncharacterized protein n=1 Tax=Hevea brasiliensis TaxID=3981 RepID=A0A6A6KAI1_HEVBR|nr:hypothetical protein GH714_008670 [Hevea brasiliensis]
MEYCLIPDGFFVSEVNIMIKRLSIIQCSSNEMLRLDISTPNLLMLAIIGKYPGSASIRKATHLNDAQVSVSAISAHNTKGDALNSLLSGLNHCQSLTLSTWSIQVIPVESTWPQRLHVPLQKLTRLRLIVGISKKELPRLSCLLMSCPNLESLTLVLSGPMKIFGFDLPSPTTYNFEEETYWESQTQSFPCLKTSLKEIKIIGLMGIRNEVQMIMFLLKNATILEKVAFSLCAPDNLYYSPDEFINFGQNLKPYFSPQHSSQTKRKTLFFSSKPSLSSRLLLPPPFRVNSRTSLPACSLSITRAAANDGDYSLKRSSSNEQTETIMLPGCDYNHWLIVMEFPNDPAPTREQMIGTYLNILATVLGSMEEAKRNMSAFSTNTYTGFQCTVSEETSEKFKGLPGVLWMLPDSYIDVKNKDYGGDNYINGEIIRCKYPTYQPKQRKDSKYASKRCEIRRDGPPEQRRPRQDATQSESASA